MKNFFERFCKTVAGKKRAAFCRVWETEKQIYAPETTTIKEKLIGLLPDDIAALEHVRLLSTDTFNATPSQWDVSPGLYFFLLFSSSFLLAIYVPRCCWHCFGPIWWYCSAQDCTTGREAAGAGWSAEKRGRRQVEAARQRRRQREALAWSKVARYAKLNHSTLSCLSR